MCLNSIWPVVIYTAIFLLCQLYFTQPYFFSFQNPSQRSLLKWLVSLTGILSFPVPMFVLPACCLAACIVRRALCISFMFCTVQGFWRVCFQSHSPGLWHNTKKLSCDVVCHVVILVVLLPRCQTISITIGVVTQMFRAWAVSQHVCRFVWFRVTLTSTDEL